MYNVPRGVFEWPSLEQATIGQPTILAFEHSSIRTFEHSSIRASEHSHFGIILGSFWDRLGIILGSFRDHLGIIWASFWASFQSF